DNFLISCCRVLDDRCGRVYTHPAPGFPQVGTAPGHREQGTPKPKPKPHTLIALAFGCTDTAHNSQLAVHHGRPGIRNIGTHRSAVDTLAPPVKAQGFTVSKLDRALTWATEC